MEHRLLLNDKYKGCTFLHTEADRGYCGWVLGSASLPLSRRPFQHYLNQRHGGLFLVGKHKDRFFDKVLHSDPARCDQASRLVQPPFHSIQSRAVAFCVVLMNVVMNHCSYQFAFQQYASFGSKLCFIVRTWYSSPVCEAVFQFWPLRNHWRM